MLQPPRAFVRFFRSGVVQRAAAAQLAKCRCGVQLASLIPEGRESLVRLLNFTLKMDASARIAATFSLGAFHTAAVMRPSPDELPLVHTFGRGFHGQLGVGGYDSSSAPVAAALRESGGAASTPRLVACGASHCAAVTSSGELFTWRALARLSPPITSTHPHSSSPSPTIS